MPKRVPLAAVVFAFTAGLATVSTQNAGTTLYMVATAHLDSQWNWTVQDTIRQFVPSTFYTNFKYFEKYPDYVFTWEGAIHYMWFKEYHPDDWPTVQKYVAAKRWRLAGSWLNAVDTNMPSPESLFRQALYAKHFFRQEFGTVSQDVYLPDCFGFGFALPSIAAHSGLKAFSTQKLTWGRPIPFPVGRWQGVDGSEIVAELNPGSYTTRVETDPTTDPKWTDDATPLGNGRSVVFRYFGTGDTGGGPTEESVANVERALQKKGGPVDIRNTSADQFSRDIKPDEFKALPLYTGELILKTHGTGCYTAQAAMKRFNRQNELLADDAEKSAVAAAYLTGLSYPTARLRESWTRFLWHQFHDDLTGTCIPQAYQFSWNDEITSMNQFASVLTSSTTAAASQLNTSGTGTPLVIFNPLSTDRHEPVEATVHLTAPAASSLSVVDADSGETVPAQVLERTPGTAKVLFMADVPAVGFKVVHVRAAAAPKEPTPSVSVGENSLENNRLSVKVDRNGDISSIYDKDAKRELLRAPIMLELRDDPSGNWPAWEVQYDTVQAPAREYVAHPVMKVIERGPVRAAIEITRHASGSTFVQRVSLTAGGDRINVENLVDWQSPNSLLKVSFPVTASNPKATYDLGVGVIERTGNEPDKYEVPAQKWADLTDTTGSFGVGIINDSKYGWDKPDDGTLRLTLLHTPRPTTRYTYQSSNDLGHHRFVFAIAGHAGDWRQGRMPGRAAEVNQPLVAFEADAHDGSLGSSFSMASLDDPTGEIAITALKHAEDSDELVVRLQERYGRTRRVTLRMPSGIVAAREINAAEEDVAPIDLSENNGGGRGNQGPRPTLSLDFKAYQPRTIALKLAPRAERAVERASAPVELPFDLDGVSTDKDRADGDFDGKKHTISAELLPHELTIDGVSFTFGPGTTGQKNVVVPNGQVLHLPEGTFTRLYLIAAAVGEDVPATIAGQRITVREWQGPVGQWWSRLKEPSALWEPFVPAIREGQTVATVPSQREIQDGLVVKWDPKTGVVSGIDQLRPAFLKRDEIAWVGSHRHSPDDNEVYVASYLFLYGIDLPAGTREVRLPSDKRLRILAASVSREPRSVRPAGALYLADFAAK